jgi:hypothetical protein
MFFSSFANGLTDHSASLYSLGDRCWVPGESGVLTNLTSVLGQESAWRLDNAHPEVPDAQVRFRAV